mmetsp:Transcript_25292/g.54964  ORF Transcript_25292/g.54964 Transcript_25292/m.54964 type:complete len:241 (+) Transcript_25292:1636-2358(+)
MVPPCISTSCLAMLRPRPVPPYLRFLLMSAWWKGLNRSAILSLAMPHPVSHTFMMMLMPRLSGYTRTDTLPCSVNLSALLTRLLSTCTSLRLSATMGGIRSLTTFSSTTPRLAMGVSVRTTRSTAPLTSTSSWLTLMPERTTLSVMMSLMMPIRCVALPVMVCIQDWPVGCSAPPAPRATALLSWMIALRGVRSSWPMTLMNSSFICTDSLSSDTMRMRSRCSCASWACSRLCCSVTKLL